MPLDPELRQGRSFIVTVFAAILVIVLIAGGAARLAGLFYLPWEIQMQTQMIRASNSYVTTQQAALRQLRAGYEDASTAAQRAATVRQMREIADLIPGNVQPDIAAFLAAQH